MRRKKDMYVIIAASIFLILLLPTSSVTFLIGGEDSTDATAFTDRTMIEPEAILQDTSCGFQDQLDQSMETPGFDMGWLMEGPYWGFQSFIPSLPVLTRVELLLRKPSSEGGGSIKVEIVKSTGFYSYSGKKIAEASSVALSEDMVWVEFDFPDVSVEPGSIYEIQCTGDGVWWCANPFSFYMRGLGVALSPDYPPLTFPTFDFCFRTYGEVLSNETKKLDLDIVRPDNTELVLEEKEDDKAAHVPGRALSLNRGTNHLKKIYVREPVNEKFLIWWSPGLELYGAADKTDKIRQGATFTTPKEFWVEATTVSKNRNDKWVQAVPRNINLKEDTVVFTNFEVEITVRTEKGEKISPQDEYDKHDQNLPIYGNDLGLGTSSGGSRYGGQAEIVGQLVPNTLREDDFSNDEFYWRQDYNEKIYLNGVLARTPRPSVADDPLLMWQDVTPSKTGKIYFSDFPSDPLPDTRADLKAVRLIFTTWCTFMYHEEPGAKGDTTHNSRPSGGYIDCSKNEHSAYYVLRTTLRGQDGWDDNSCWQGNKLFASETKPASGWLHLHYLFPIIDSVSPPRITAGPNIKITVTGDGFFSTPTVTLEKFSPRVTIASTVKILAKDQIECTFNIPNNAVKGTYYLKLKEPQIDGDGNGTPDITPLKLKRSAVTIE